MSDDHPDQGRIDFYSKYLDPGTLVTFDDELAGKFQPLIFDPYGYGKDPAPEGVFYRILNKGDEKVIQYYVYWEKQDCKGEVLGELYSHDYDYEPVFIFTRGDEVFRVVLAGEGKPAQAGHRTDIYEVRDRRLRDYTDNVPYTTGPKTQYPFGENRSRDEVIVRSISKLAFEGKRLKICLAACYHVYDALDPNMVRGPVLVSPLRRLDDSVLDEWYNEEHFGHDVSNPWVKPYIRYHPPPPARDQIEKRKKQRDKPVRDYSRLE
jgi:hypothetical protein